MPVREPSRGKKRQVGSRADRSENEGLPMAGAGLVGQFEFTEWTPDNHLRHSRCVALRDDKDPKDVAREG